MALYRCGSEKTEPPLEAVNIEGTITISAWSVPFNAGTIAVPGSYTSPGVTRNIAAGMYTASVTILVSAANKSKSLEINRTFDEALGIALDCAMKNDTESEFYTGDKESV